MHVLIVANAISDIILQPAFALDILCAGIRFRCERAVSALALLAVFRDVFIRPLAFLQHWREGHCEDEISETIFELGDFSAFIVFHSWPTNVLSF